MSAHVSSIVSLAPNCSVGPCNCFSVQQFSCPADRLVRTVQVQRSRRMALLQDRDASRCWSSLLVTISQMVDWVHFTTTHDTFHQVVSPKIWETVSKLSGIYAGDGSDIDLGTELRQLLMEHSWNGRSFSREVSAVNLLSALKNFKVKSEKTLGKGAYAKVLLARSMLTGEVIVHKHVQIDSPEHGLPLHVLRELAILQKMRHPHIVRYVPLFLPAIWCRLHSSGGGRAVHLLRLSFPVLHLIVPVAIRSKYIP